MARSPLRRVGGAVGTIPFPGLTRRGRVSPPRSQNCTWVRPFGRSWANVGAAKFIRQSSSPRCCSDADDRTPPISSRAASVHHERQAHPKHPAASRMGQLHQGNRRGFAWTSRWRGTVPSTPLPVIVTEPHAVVGDNVLGCASEAHHRAIQGSTHLRCSRLQVPTPGITFG